MRDDTLEPIQDLPARRLNGYFSNGLRAAYGGWPLDAPAGAVRPATLLRPQARPGATAVGGS